MQPSLKPLNAFVSNHLLLILLSLATIIGLTFIFIVPPWEHYDEPGHFEYAWLAANKSEWPKEGDYDQSMRREVGASMLEHNFHDYSIYHLLSNDEPISIIIPQTGDVPLYYFLVSIPLRLIKFSDITFQLYVARFVSFTLFLFTIFLAYKTTALLFQKGHLLRWMVSLFLICLPGLVDIMTAVNNDAGAIAFFTFFIYASLLILVRGLSFKRIALLILAVTLCVLTKSTSILAAPLSLLIIVLSIIKKQRVLKTLIIGFVAILVVSLVVFSLDTTSPAYFYADNFSYLPIRETQEQAPLGKVTIVQEAKENKWLYFNLPISTREFEPSETITLTLGAWVWADSPTVIQFPNLKCLGTYRQHFFTSEPVSITDTPTYYSFNTSPIDNLTGFCWLAFYGNTDPDTSIYWDGILLTEGQFNNETLPSFIDDQAKKAIWDGESVINLIKNGSGEIAWPVASNLTQKVLSGRTNVNISSVFSVFDLDHFSWYYHSTLAHLFRSFWGVFGWGNIHFTGTHPYRYFLVFSLLGGLGAILSLRHKLTSNQITTAFFFACVIIIQLVIVLFRGVGTCFTYLFIPHSRYFYPVVLPVSVIVISGFYEIFKWIDRNLHVKRAILFLILICAVITPTLWAVISIIQF